MVGQNDWRQSSRKESIWQSFWMAYFKCLMKKNSCCSLFSPILQFVFIVIGVLVYILDPVAKIQDWGMKITPGSPYFHYWTSLPVTIHIKIYYFNVTNHEEFLAGKEKLRVEEVGPFVYTEKWLINNVTFNDNKTVTYIPSRIPEFQRHLSVGDPKAMHIITPNIPFAAFSSLLAKRSPILSLTFKSAARFLSLTPFHNLSIEEIAWGYDDPLIDIANTFITDWLPFERLGMLDRLYDEGTNVVTIRLEDNGLSPTEPGYLPQYSIDQFNGSPGFSKWGYTDEDYKNRETPLVPKPIERCKLLRGGTETLLFPRHMDHRIISRIYRKPFCRTLPIEFKKKEQTFFGIQTDKYQLPKGVFDSAEISEYQRCFCDPSIETCLPSGFSLLAPCFYQLPMTASMPHFYEVDPKELDKIEGLKHDAEKHTSFLNIQPNLGIVLDVAERIQVNLWVQNVTLIPSLQPLANRNIPVFWCELIPGEIPSIIIFLLYLVLWILPATQFILYGLGCISALIFVHIPIRWIYKNRGQKFLHEGNEPEISNNCQHYESETFL